MLTGKILLGHPGGKGKNQCRRNRTERKLPGREGNRQVKPIGDLCKTTRHFTDYSEKTERVKPKSKAEGQERSLKASACWHKRETKGGDRRRSCDVRKKNVTWGSEAGRGMRHQKPRQGTPGEGGQPDRQLQNIARISRGREKKHLCTTEGRCRSSGGKGGQKKGRPSPE